MISIAKPHGDPVPVGSSQMKIGTEDDKRKTPVPLEVEILCQNTEDPMDFWIWLNRRIQQSANLEITGKQGEKQDIEER